MSHHVNFSKRQAPARERLKWVDLPTAALVSETGFKDVQINYTNIQTVPQNLKVSREETLAAANLLSLLGYHSFAEHWPLG